MGGWKIGRIGGVAVYVHPSWAIIALFLGFSEWTGFSDRFVFPSLSPAGALALAAITTLLFFGSVLAHELAHAEMSRARGIPVLGITLLLFGGVTHSTESPRTPKEEFLVTVVGPVTNLAIGGALLALHVWGGGFLSKPIRVGMVGFLAVENLLLGGFNLLPGFPLDGGRVLRALVWRATGDQRKATIVAGRGGQAVALLMVAAGITWTATTGNGLTLIWSVFIGMFIFQSASAAIAESRRQVLHDATVREVMSPPPPTVDAELPLGVAIDRYLQGHAGEAFPVVRGDQVIGFVSLRTAQGLSPDHLVQDAMVGGNGVVGARPDQRMSELFDRSTDTHDLTVLVLDQGRLVGVIEPEDVTRYLRRTQLLPGPGAPEVPPPPAPPRPDLPATG